MLTSYSLVDKGGETRRDAYSRTLVEARPPTGLTVGGAIAGTAAIVGIRPWALLGTIGAGLEL